MRNLNNSSTTGSTRQSKKQTRTTHWADIILNLTVLLLTKAKQLTGHCSNQGKKATRIVSKISKNYKIITVLCIIAILNIGFMLLMQAGDVEPNPGPILRTTQQQQELRNQIETDRWFGYDPRTAKIYLNKLLKRAYKVDTASTAEDKIQAYQKLQDKAMTIHMMLPKAQALPAAPTWGWARQLRQDFGHQHTARQYHAQVRHILKPENYTSGTVEQLVHCASSTGDGNCLFNTISMHLLGNEYGNVQLRLRAALGTILFPSTIPRLFDAEGKYIETTLDTIKQVCRNTAFVSATCARHIAEFWNINIYFLYPGPRTRARGTHIEAQAGFEIDSDNEGEELTTLFNNIPTQKPSLLMEPLTPQAISTLCKGETLKHIITPVDTTHNGLECTTEHRKIMICWAGPVLQGKANHYVPAFLKNEEAWEILSTAYKFTSDTNSRPNQENKSRVLQSLNSMIARTPITTIPEIPLYAGASSSGEAPPPAAPQLQAPHPQLPPAPPQPPAAATQQSLKAPAKVKTVKKQPVQRKAKEGSLSAKPQTYITNWFKAGVTWVTSKATGTTTQQAREVASQPPSTQPQEQELFKKQANTYKNTNALSSNQSKTAPTPLSEQEEHKGNNSDNGNMTQTGQEHTQEAEQGSSIHQVSSSTEPSPHMQHVGEQTLIVWNTRGMGGNSLSTYSIQEMAHTHDSAILILTETKQTHDKNIIPKALTKLLPTHAIYSSCKPNKTQQISKGKKQQLQQQNNSHLQRKAGAAGGVLIAIPNQLAQGKAAAPISTPEHLNGHITAIQLPSSIHKGGIRIIGVYVDPEDNLLHEQCLKFISKQIKLAETDRALVIIGGDFNARLLPEDHSHPRNADSFDKRHQAFCAKHNLKPHPEEGGRQYTYERDTKQPQLACRSRIDDIFVINHNSSRHDICNLSTMTTTGSDHRPLMGKIKQEDIGTIVQKTEAKGKYGGNTNPLKGITHEEGQLIKITLEAADTPETAACLTKVNKWKAAYETPTPNNPTPTRQEINEMGEQLASIYNSYQDTVLGALNIQKKCTKEQPKHYRSRTKSRAIKKLYDIYDAAKEQLTKLTTIVITTRTPPPAPSEAKSQMEPEPQNSLPTQPPQQQEAAQEGKETGAPAAQEPPKWQETIETVSRAKNEITSQNRELRKEEAAKHKKGVQDRHQKNRKASHKQIYQNITTEKPMEAIRHPVSKILHTSSAGILECAQTYFQMGMAKDKKCLPNITPPWESTGTPDPMKVMQPEVPSPPKPYDTIADKITFKTYLNNLKMGTAPGPDTINNEIIKWAPEVAKELLHAFIICCWHAGTTPASWKSSNTILIHKKGDTTNLDNYRPISMANTLAKVWTGMIAEALSNYLEARQAISPSQEGFRKGKNTIRQATRTIKTIEDAATTKKDIYILYVDFAQAFNTVDHTKLQEIMRMLECPEQTINIVKDLYQDTTTKIVTPTGSTCDIPVRRGTLQGDSLSPLLFLIFIEPLLRWLQQGNRGYQYGCLTVAQNRQYNNAAGAFADDLQITTNNIQDMQVQADKISKFCTWTGIKVNHSKCAVTGATFGKWNKTSTSPNLNDPELERQLTDKIMISGQHIPFLPPKQSYEYLGLDINMALDWTSQFNKLCKKIKAKGARLTSSHLSAMQKDRALDETIATMIDYSLNVTPFTNKQLTHLDGLIAGIKRKALGLPSYYPTYSLIEEAAQGGWGKGESVRKATMYAISNLCMNLNDTGAIGLITKALLTIQMKQLTAHPLLQTPQHHQATMYASTIRQTNLLHPTPMQIVRDGETLDSNIKPSNILGLVQHAYEVIYGHREEGDKDYPPLPITPIRHLWEIGCINLEDIITNNGKTPTLITPADLARKLGSKVESKHKLALTQITHILTHNMTKDEVYTSITHHRNSTSNNRVVHPSHSNATHAIQRTLTIMDQLRLQVDQGQQGQAAQAAHTSNPANEQTCTVQKKTRTQCKREDNDKNKQRKRHEHSWAREQHEHCAHCLQGKTMECDDCIICKTNWTHQSCKQTQGEWICHECSTQENWEDTYWQSAHEDYNEQRSKNKILMSAGTTFPCDKNRRRPPSDPAALAVYAMDKHAPMDPYLYLAMYDCQDIPEAIITPCTNYKTVTYETISENNKRCRMTKSESDAYATIQWNNTYIMAHHLPTITAMGYTPSQIIQTYTTTPPKPTSMPLLLQQHASEDTPVLHIRWQPRDEDRRSFISRMPQQWESMFLAYNDKVNAVLREQNQMKADKRIEHQTKLEQQGIWENAKTYRPSLYPKLKGMVTINPNPINPDMDIHPQGRICMQEDLVQPYNHIYDVQGKYQASIPTSRRNFLYNLICCIKGPASTTGFEAALLHSIKLQRHRQTKTKKHPPPTQLPNKLAKAILDTIGPFYEPLTSATHVSEYAGGYASNIMEDQLLGATATWYEQPWVGINVCKPPRKDEQWDKSIRWAIGSCMAKQEPCCTFLLLPFVGRASYHKWTTNPHVHKIATLKATATEQTEGWTMQQLMAQPHTPQQASTLYAIANQAGYTEYLKNNTKALNAELRKQLGADVEINTTRIPSNLGDPNRKSYLIHLNDFRTPSKLRKQVEAESTSPKNPEQGCARQPQWEHRFPLLHNPMQYTYTDGSAKKVNGVPVIGTGIYVAATGTGYTCNPNGKEETLTITRAELVGVQMALHVAPRDQPLYILTDSLTSVYLCETSLKNPAKAGKNKHAALLQEISDIILERARQGAPTYIGKVKAHEGIAGNEKADTLANEAAESNDTAQLTTTVDNIAHLGCYWPHTVNPDTGSSRQAADLTKGIMAQIPVKRMETKGIYNGLWRDIVPYMWQSMVAFVHSAGITHNRRKALMQYRQGTIYNAKIARRIGRPYGIKQHARPKPGVKAPCPLCGCEDSGGHIMGSCEHKQMKGLYILRHNDAVRVLDKAMHQSTTMSDGLTWMDAGKDEAEHTLGTRIPEWILPNVPREDRLKMRPDILFMQGAPDAYAERTETLEDKSGITIHLIELGYGADTRYLEKRAAKKLQHQALAAALREEGWTVVVHTIIIGTGGTLFEDLQQFLRDTLELKTCAQEKIGRKIIRITADRAYQLLQTRRWLERTGPAKTENTGIKGKGRKLPRILPNG
jgi:ribonuclease HI